MSIEISVFGAERCEDTKCTRQYLNSLDVPYRYVNVDKDECAAKRLSEWNHGISVTPMVVISGNGRTVRLAHPTNEEIGEVLREMMAPAA
jgi:arsenate reductase-like glutaredoxin family protein